jgi:competence protein ComEC
MTRRLHVSWLIAGLMAGIVAGAAFAVIARPPLTGSLLIICVLLLAGVGLHARRIWALALMLLCGILLGMARGGDLQADLQKYEPFIGHTATVVGTIAEDPSLAGEGEQRLRLREVTIGDHRLPGIVWISTFEAAEFKRSDVVAFRGELSEGFGNLPASMWRAQLISADRPAYADLPRQMRDSFAEGGAAKAIPEPEVDLGMGFLTGQKSALPPELDEQLRLLGLTHVVVASGYNLTILVRFARGLLARRSKYLALASSLLMIAAFIGVTGASPSMSRAGLVAVLSLLAWYVGRNIHPVALLLIAAGVTAFVQPSYVWGDLGWLLSFLSFAGVMLLAPLIRDYFFAAKTGDNWIVRILVETTSAQLMTLPLIVYVFGQYSPYALLANLLILPLVPLAMLLTFAGGLLALASASLASIWGFPATVVLTYMTSMVEWMARLPGAAAELTISLPIALLGYAGLLVIGLYLWRATHHSFRRDNIID